MCPHKSKSPVNTFQIDILLQLSWFKTGLLGLIFFKN